MSAQTARLALTYPVATDASNVPGDMQRLANALDSVATVFVQNTFANRPAAATAGRLFLATDTSNVYYDTGSVWVQLNLNTASVIQAKGDLLVGSGAAALARLPVGTNGQLLQAQSGATNGVQWASSPLGLPLGLPGATAASRYVGGTTSGAPTTGTFAVGDYAIAANGITWICTVAGTPGTWAPSYAPAIGQALELTGATAATRYAGGVTSGVPTTGTFATGDFVVSQNGSVHICTVGGTPGTWVRAVGRTLGPYVPASYAANSYATPPLTVATVVVPDPGFAWYPLAFGSLEVAGGLNTRPAGFIYINQSLTNANLVAHGSGFDPSIVGYTGTAPYWQAAIVPFRGPLSSIAAGASAANRTFTLAVSSDYGPNQVQNTAFYASMEVWVMPAS